MSFRQSCSNRFERVYSERHPIESDRTGALPAGHGLRLKVPSEKLYCMVPYVRAVPVFLAAIACTASFGQQNRFIDILRANRYELSTLNGRLSGAGVPVLRGAMGQAQFVLVGEDHGIAQIPEFVGGLCDILAPQGFHTLAIEAGPLAAGELQRSLANRSTARTRAMDFERQFPNAIAFYDMREENDLLSRCAQAVGTKTLSLWGIDQEFLGAPKLILTRILGTHPGPKATQVTERLLNENERADAEAAEHPISPDKEFIIAAHDEDLGNLKRLLQAEGNQLSQSLIEALIQTHEIYKLNNAGSGYESNRQRALLMKALFEGEYREAERVGPEPPKVLFKFGLYHMYRGFNPLNSLEIGNHIAELAEGHGTKSVHIMVIAARGSQLAFTAYRQPYQPREFNQIDGDDASLPFLKPMVENLADSGWTLFDLRELRKNIQLIGSSELRRVILGFDLLVIIPEAKPSTQLQ